jgi:hypothetical protein
MLPDMFEDPMLGGKSFPSVVKTYYLTWPFLILNGAVITLEFSMALLSLI